MLSFCHRKIMFLNFYFLEHTENFPKCNLLKCLNFITSFKINTVHTRVYVEPPSTRGVLFEYQYFQIVNFACFNCRNSLWKVRKTFWKYYYSNDIQLEIRSSTNTRVYTVFWRKWTFIWQRTTVKIFLQK